MKKGSPIKVVQTVSVGCIGRSQGQKIGFQNSIFKNLLVWNYKAQSFHIWYVASSRGPLPKLFKLCPWGQNWPRPGGHNFTLNYIRKSSNDIFSWTANGNLTKLHRNDPRWSPTKIVQMVPVGYISRSLGLERMPELLRVREPWLKFGHEYSPYQSSDGSQISYLFQTTVHWIR